MLKTKSLIIATFAALLLLAGVFSLPSPTPTITWTPAQYTTPTQYTDQYTQPAGGLSNNNYYTNSNGNQVHSPAYSTNGSVPAGATAQCADGTYSFSQSRSGTCSAHGGVSKWLT